MNNEEIKSALESLNDPLVHNQALIDCRNLLNLSKATLEEHLLSWLWVAEGVPAYEGGELLYSIELGRIEEHLVMNSLVYTD
jgi:hypothetical protein